MLPTGEGNGKPLQYSCLEIPMNTMEGTRPLTYVSPWTQQYCYEIVVNISIPVLQIMTLRLDAVNSFLRFL